MLGPRVGVTRVTLRTAVSWTLLGVTQGTLAVEMRVQGMMRPFLGSLWVPYSSWVRTGSVSGSCWVGALLLESTVDRVVETAGTVLGVVRLGRVVGMTGTVLGVVRPSLV